MAIELHQKQANVQNPNFHIYGNKVIETGWVLSPYTNKWIYYSSEKVEMSEVEINLLKKNLKSSFNHMSKGKQGKREAK